MRLRVIEMKKGVWGKRCVWMDESIRMSGRGNVLGWFVIAFPPFLSSFSSQQLFSFCLPSRPLERCHWIGRELPAFPLAVVFSTEHFWAPTKDTVVVQARAMACQAPELAWKIPSRRKVNLLKISSSRNSLFYGIITSKCFSSFLYGQHLQVTWHVWKYLIFQAKQELFYL